MRNNRRNILGKGIRNLMIASGVGVYCFIAGMLFFGANGLAYIDPSVMTYVIQAVSGVVIALGAVAGIYWRKAKKKLNDKLEIDENKNKEVESDDIQVYEK